MKGTKPELRSDSLSLDSVLPAPEWLGEKARGEWARVMPILTERRILTEADLGNLENYCVAAGRVREFEGAIQTEADTELMLKLFRAQDKAMSSARQLSAELGLTPVSRSRPAIREDRDDEPDPLDV